MESFDARRELYDFLKSGGKIYLPPEIDRLAALQQVEQEVLPWTRIGFTPSHFMETGHPNLWTYIFLSSNKLHMTNTLLSEDKVRDIFLVMEMLTTSSMPNASELIELLSDSEVFV